jgi:4-hydroxy-tetrahydrodipicolinate synthase
MELHSLAPKIVIWETDIIAAGSGGLMKRGIVSPVMLGNVGYVLETPDKMIYTGFWNLLMEGKLTEATHFFYDSGLSSVMDSLMMISNCPYRPGYIGHWGSGIKFAASLLGLPVGDFPHSRPPQPPFPAEMKQGIIDVYGKAGFIKKPAK